MEQAPSHDDRRPSIYEAAGGDEGIRRLAEAWHARVLTDPVVSHAFSHGFRRDHTERLAAYWAEALGGPPTYSARYGDETFVVRLHSGNGEHDDMDRRAIACFAQALEDAGLAQDAVVAKALHDYFAWATTGAMARYPASPDDVPDGLEIARWSWDGPQAPSPAMSPASGVRMPRPPDRSRSRTDHPDRPAER